MATSSAPSDFSQTGIAPDGETLRLSQLARGTARVVRVDGDAADVARLMALGICLGRRIEVIKQGDPLIVRVVGSRVGLSARLAAGVVVSRAEGAVDSVHAA